MVSRDNESGWIRITLGQRMSPEEAKKDLAIFPWKEVEQEVQHDRDK